MGKLTEQEKTALIAKAESDAKAFENSFGETGSVPEKGKTQPYMKKKAGTIQATVWENRGIDPRSKREFTSFSVSLQRGYFDQKTNSWKNTDSYRLADLPKLRLLIDEIFKELTINAPENAE